MKTGIVVFLLFTVVTPLVSQAQNTLEEGMKQGFELFTDGDKFEDWKRAAEMLVELGEQHPSAWLPEYWASYFYTQIAMAFPREDAPPPDLTAMGLVDLAQAHFDTAFRKAEDMTPQVRSDFHALQSLIYTFRGVYAESEQEKETYQQMEDEEIKSAIRANADNPLITVIISTDLAYRWDFRSLYAARTLLLHAKQQYEDRQGPRYLSTHWNEEWLGFWMSQAEKGLATLTQPEPAPENQ